ERAGTLRKRRIVQKREGLERRVGALAPRAGRAWVGTVEVLQHGVRKCALHVHINPAPVTVGPAAGWHQPLALELRSIDQRGRQWRLDAWTSNRGVKESARGQAKVANDLGIDPAAVLPCQKRICRIALCQVGPLPRRLTIGCRRDDEPDQMLPAPAGSPEL